MLGNQHVGVHLFLKGEVIYNILYPFSSPFPSYNKDEEGGFLHVPSKNTPCDETGYIH
ncbi:hypothetical protein BRE01_51930 [Brevibacillus reuszeri]|uniref:Uncharacterized protein n=1 Tax=Brevibacillus reuszeri TaxID=54915 RepID=A0ABQ0TUN6_9BACL|nr:hypothetical protein BRE01_51930 [Brevibacillus reuszeri]